ncbi:hypothetical protein [Pedobacter sp.]|jgi:hypothetical protein|uniref:hypothetical protein n=1 Tax=Pedobacter sp. TaxID=1411316 RepID=UPI002C98CE6E|nr:hypothetical protein [Pedobacter sp.]HWW43399.1 hypothetical protein [Pedobacter sp.]
MTKEEQEVYDQQRKRKWDNEAVKEQQRLDFEEWKKRRLAEEEEIGVELGKELGKVEGEQTKAREIAIALKKMGLSNEQISVGTGLSIEEIEKL